MAPNDYRWVVSPKEQCGNRIWTTQQGLFRGQVGEYRIHIRAQNSETSAHSGKCGKIFHVTVIFWFLVEMNTLAEFDDQGAAVISGFASDEEIESMRSRMYKLIDGWDPEHSLDSVFRTTEEQHIRNEYFLKSADQISFFLEECGLDPFTGKIRNDVPKAELVNKAGHGLHLHDDVFRDFTFSDKIVQLVKDLGYKDPVLPQSMYIFKQPRIGGVVKSHQDSTFLFTEPRLTCLGLWLALDDADESNGCLWYRPGSHKEPLRRRLIRTPAESYPTKFVQLEEDSKYDGSMPEDLRAAGFIPIPVHAGDLVLIHGSVDHLSLPNTSNKPRHSYQLHLVDGPNSGVTWSKDNWLQYGSENEFARLSIRS